jgi:HAD superfamily hydrolase (TIGR01549 family)
VTRADLEHVRAVFFDVGEVLIDETTEYGTWADWLGVPRHTFSAIFGAVIARGEDYRQVFQHFRPGFNLADERKRRFEAGLGEFFNGRDLYPDARPCLQALTDAGFFVGVAGNQTERAGRLLRELHLPVHLIATSDDWGAEKPCVKFFEKLISVARQPAERILYVGDRMDNDVLPALEAGLKVAHIRRGPWGYQHTNHPEIERVHLRLDSLEELPGLLCP